MAQNLTAQQPAEDEIDAHQQKLNENMLQVLENRLGDAEDTPMANPNNGFQQHQHQNSAQGAEAQMQDMSSGLKMQQQQMTFANNNSHHNEHMAHFAEPTTGAPRETPMVNGIALSHQSPAACTNAHEQGGENLPKCETCLVKDERIRFLELEREGLLFKMSQLSKNGLKMKEQLVSENAALKNDLHTYKYRNMQMKTLRNKLDFIRKIVEEDSDEAPSDDQDSVSSQDNNNNAGDSQANPSKKPKLSIATSLVEQQNPTSENIVAYRKRGRKPKNFKFLTRPLMDPPSSILDSTDMMMNSTTAQSTGQDDSVFRYANGQNGTSTDELARAKVVNSPMGVYAQKTAGGRKKLYNADGEEIKITSPKQIFLINENILFQCDGVTLTEREKQQLYQKRKPNHAVQFLLPLVFTAEEAHKKNCTKMLKDYQRRTVAIINYISYRYDIEVSVAKDIITKKCHYDQTFANFDRRVLGQNDSQTTTS